ncbi:MAG: CARDB domain-containing protein, partial [Planctomycetota bacterium]
MRPMAFEPLEPRLLLSAGSSEELLALGGVDATDQGLRLAPEGYVYEDAAGGDVSPTGSRVLYDVPEYFWYNGCGPTAAGMVLGYWDLTAYPNYFVGDASTQTADVNAGIASAGHIADWAVTPDAPPPHHADDSIADFMGTSRGSLPFGWSSFGDVDDAFRLYSDMVGYWAAHSWNETYGSLTFADLQNEIDAGRPMVFLVDHDGSGGTDHFVPIIGYRTYPTNQYACYTTWSNDPGVHWFDWRGLASGNDWGIYGGTYFHPAHNAIDLAPTYANATPDTLVWGDTVDFSYGVKNYGTDAAGGFYIKYYLSYNETISTGDHYLGYTYVSGGLAGGASTSGIKTLTLPPETSLPPGFDVEDDAWIGMIVDPDHYIAEGAGMEGNNSNLGEWIDYDGVRIDGKPDLTGTNFELDSGMLNLGSVVADFSVKNVGQGDAGSFYVGFYLSENSFISTGDTLLGERYVSGLSNGSTYSSTITLSPDTADPFGKDGTYTIGMLIDYKYAVVEASEANNSNEGLGIDMAEASYGRKIFVADFEHGDGAMDIDNDLAWAPVDGLWHLTTNRGSNKGHTPTHSLHYGRYDRIGGDWDYDVGDSAGLFMTKRLALPDEPISLTFNYLAETEAGTAVDKMIVQVHDPAAGTYVTVLDKSTLDNNTGGFWRRAEADLTAWRGKNVRLRFIFDSVNSFLNNMEGWYVDDITVWAASNPVRAEGFRSLKYDSNYYHEPSAMHY